MVRPARAIEARRLKVTPELLANIRHRYEHTDESLSTMAADLGCTGQTVCNIAKREGWVRYVPPPRDLSPAARLLARAEALAGDRRPSRLAMLAPQGDGESPPPEGGEEEKIADTAEALHDAARKLLADVKASRAQLAGKPQSPLDQERAARTLANLTATLQKLSPLRGGVPLTESHTGNDYDDMPADLDAFRDELARRIRIFVEGRRARSGADGIAGDDADAAQS
jgi:hypothetical protein